MKALRLKAKGILALEDIPEPEVSEGSQLITIEAVGIGGSEYLGFNNPGIRPLPNIMGHGFSGTTAKGKRVVIYPLSGCGICEYCKAEQEQLCDQWSLIGVHTDGGFAQKAAIPNRQLFELPQDLSWEQSVFIEPFANAINAWQLSEASASDTVAIIGAGSLGLGLIALAHESGCTQIHVAEPSTNRRNIAKTLGARETMAELDTTYDIVFDTVGSIATRDQTIRSTKKGGKCIFLGFETPELTIKMSEIIRHQKTLQGSFVYSRSQFSQAIELAKLCDDHWVNNIAFNEVEKTLKEFSQGNFDKIKVALRPNA